MNTAYYSQYRAQMLYLDLEKRVWDPSLIQAELAGQQALTGAVHA